MTADAITELQQVILDTESVGEFLAEMARQAAGLVPDGLSCGMTVQERGRRRPVTVACNDEAAQRADEAQYAVDDGPCLRSMRRNETIRIDDMAGETRWPHFAAEARRLGIGSCLALPLRVRGESLGALNLYGHSVRAFSDAVLRQASLFAEQASVSLALCLRLSSYVTLNEQLRASLESRAIIDQALGVLMSRERIDATQALSLLRSASQRGNVKLRDIAAVIIATATGKEPAGPSPFEE